MRVCHYLDMHDWLYNQRLKKIPWEESFLNVQALYACLKVTFVQMFPECDKRK